MSYLYIARHAKSEYNEKGIWTGWSEPHLSKDGFVNALTIGEKLKNEQIDIAFTNVHIRNKETLAEIKKGMGRDFPTYESPAINERDYGVLTGKNKWEIKKEVGEKEFNSIRRSWDHKIEGGETLKDVSERSIPYFKETILPELNNGKNVLLVCSGNTLRSMIKVWEEIPDEGIGDVEVAMGQVIRYEFDQSGKYLNKKVIYSGEIDQR